MTSHLLTTFLRGLPALLLLPLAGAQTPSFTQESADELQTAGDWNNDGRTDLLLADRALGLFRYGFQLPNGQLDWQPVLPSGLATIDALAAGRLTHSHRDTVAFASFSSNRLTRIDDLTVPSASPTVLPLAGSGPAALAAVDLVHAGNDPLLADLALGTHANVGLLPSHLEYAKNTVGTFSLLSQVSLNGPLFSANPVVLQSGTPARLAALERNGPSLSLLLRDTQTAGFPVTGQWNNLPASTRYLAAPFTGAPFTQFLTYQPGHAGFSAASVQPGFTFAPPADFVLPQPVQSLHAVPTASVWQLLVIYENGTSAEFFAFDGVNPPVSLGTIPPSTDLSFSGLLAGTPGELFLLSSPIGTRRTSHAQRFQHDGNAWQAGPVSPLPDPGFSPLSANVLTFQGEPFVVEQPKLLTRYRSRGWTADFQLSGAPGDVLVSSFSYQDAATGLGDLQLRNLGAANAASTHGLPNQVRDDLSLVFAQATLGDIPATVTVTPGSGTRSTSFQPFFQCSEPGFTIYYAILPSALWTTVPANGLGEWIFQDTTLLFFARHPDGRQSTINTALYDFTVPIDQLDSDSDGVPDYVEIGLGLDPVKSGDDGDADGYRDLIEILNFTSPLDPSDPVADPMNPPPAEDYFKYELQSVFDLAITPLAHRGTNDPDPYLYAVDPVDADDQAALIKAYGLDGFYAGSATATLFSSPLPAPDHATALIRELDAGTPLFVVIANPGFDLDFTPAVPDPRRGREMAALAAPPPLAAPAVPALWDGGTLLNETNEWILSAQATYLAQSRARLAEVLEHRDTLALVLFEQFLGQTLLARGLLPTDRVSLTPFRGHEITWPANQLPFPAGGVVRLDSELLTALQTPQAVLPSYDLASVAATIRQSIDQAATPEIVQLEALANDLYRISAALANDQPGAYPPPLDTLRSFLRTGELTGQDGNVSYAAATSLQPAQLAQALAGATQILGTVPQRSLVHYTMTVQPGSFGGPCVYLRRKFTSLDYDLFNEAGDSFSVVQAASLIPGTEILATGYDDLPASCHDRGFQVFSLTVLDLPPGEKIDTDANLLPDSWERAFFGLTGQSPFQDDDGDGFFNLQELFDGTDPNDGEAMPDGMPKDIDPPELTVVSIGGGDLQITWDYPPEYDSFLEFQVLFSLELGGEPFQVLDIVGQHLGGGHYQAIVDGPETDGQPVFYQVKLGLQ